jgi:hypothetical protein
MFTHLSKFKAVAVAAAAVFSISSAHAVTYLDNFSSYSFGAFTDQASADGFGAWDVELLGGTVTLINDIAPYGKDLALSGGAILTYSFTLASASTVVLTFDEGADNNHGTALLVNGGVVDSTFGSSFGPQSWPTPPVSNTFSLGAGSHTFTFANTGSGAFYLDNFSVNVTAAPVPEPETYAMMLAGLGALGFMARRRRAS